MPLIATVDHLPVLDTLAKGVSQETVHLLLVEDCREWAASSGIDLRNRNPRAMAVRMAEDKSPVVVLRREYEQEHLDEQASALFAQGWPDQASEVKDPAAFLRFLVLHELAHLLNNWPQEREQDCNEWAFQRLGWW